MKVMVDRRHAADQLLKKEDQDPRHCSTIITPQFLMREKGLGATGANVTKLQRSPFPRVRRLQASSLAVSAIAIFELAT